MGRSRVIAPVQYPNPNPYIYIYIYIFFFFIIGIIYFHNWHYYGTVLFMVPYGHMLYLFFVHLLVNFLFSLVKYLYFFFSHSHSSSHPQTLSQISLNHSSSHHQISLNHSSSHHQIHSPHPLNTDQIPLIKNK